METKAHKLAKKIDAIYDSFSGTRKDFINKIANAIEDDFKSNMERCVTISSQCIEGYAGQSGDDLERSSTDFLNQFFITLVRTNRNTNTETVFHPMITRVEGIGSGTYKIFYNLPEFHSDNDANVSYSVSVEVLKKTLVATTIFPVFYRGEK